MNSMVHYFKSTNSEKLIRIPQTLIQQSKFITNMIQDCGVKDKMTIDLNFPYEVVEMTCIFAEKPNFDIPSENVFECLKFLDYLNASELFDKLVNSINLKLATPLTFSEPRVDISLKTDISKTKKDDSYCIRLSYQYKSKKWWFYKTDINGTISCKLTLYQPGHPSPASFLDCVMKSFQLDLPRGKEEPTIADFCLYVPVKKDNEEKMELIVEERCIIYRFDKLAWMNNVREKLAHFMMLSSIFS